MNKKSIFFIIGVIVVIVLIILLVTIKIVKVDNYSISNTIDYDSVDFQNTTESNVINVTLDNEPVENTIISSTITNSTDMQEIENNTDDTKPIIENTDKAIYEQFDNQTFYATIEKINEYNGKTTVLVKGLEDNDINFRGGFNFGVDDNTKILLNNNEVEKSELEIGQTILIEFTGVVLESSPAKIDVIKIVIQ